MKPFRLFFAMMLFSACQFLASQAFAGGTNHTLPSFYDLPEARVRTIPLPSPNQQKPGESTTPSQNPNAHHQAILPTTNDRMALFQAGASC